MLERLGLEIMFLLNFYKELTTNQKHFSLFTKQYEPAYERLLMDHSSHNYNCMNSNLEIDFQR